MTYNKQAGFTLIELVVVIIILAVLAVTAAPKFINFKSDAIIANLNTLQGSLKSANSLVYSKAVLAGQEKLTPGSIDNNGTAISTTVGYITPAAANIANALEGSYESMATGTSPFTADFGIQLIPGGTPTGSTSVWIFPKGYNASSSPACYLHYNIDPTATAPVFYSLSTNGC